MDTRRESKRMDPARRHFGFALNQGTPAFNAFFLRIVTSSSSVVCLGLCVEQKARTLPLVLFSRLKPQAFDSETIAVATRPQIFTVAYHIPFPLSSPSTG
jgi:hypothetical protein